MFDVDKGTCFYAFFFAFFVFSNEDSESNLTPVGKIETLAIKNKNNFRLNTEELKLTQ